MRGQLQRNPNISTPFGRAQSVSIQLLILAFILLLPWPNAFASFPNGGPDFGWVLVGTQKCVSHPNSSYYWQNLSPGGTFACDSHGCSCSPAEVARTTSLSTSSGFSVTPSTPVVVPACVGFIDFDTCVTPTSQGDYNGTLTATVSPAFNNGSTSQSTSMHVKGIPSMVTAEPLGENLNLGSAQVGQTKSGSFQVCNYRSSPVTINSISVNDGNFSVAGGVGTVIPAVQSQYTPTCRAVTINFTPQATGNFSSNIQINTTAEDPTYTCSGTGTPGPFITTPSTGNGTITPSTSVQYGGNITVTMTPSTGNTLNSLTDNGSTRTASSGPSGAYTYTLSSITIDHTLVASFRTMYTVTANVTGSGGTVSPTSATNSYGRTGQSFTLTPYNGYTLDKIIDNGIDVISSAYVN
jgi:hypothetical protein